MNQPYQIDRRHPIEVMLMRLGLAIVVMWSLPTAPQMAELTSQSNPVGMARLFDLTFLANPELFGWLRIITVLALVFYVLGIGVAAALTVAAGVHILSLTLYNSQGVAFHAHNIVSLVLLAQWLVYLWPWVCRVIPKLTCKLPVGRSLADLSIHFSLQIIAGAYVIAGVIKLLRSKGLWIFQSPDIAVELLKTNAQNYYNWLEIDPAYEHRQQVAQWLIENPNISRILLGSGLLIEVFAFLLLYNRTAAFIAGIFLIGLHWGIDLTMGLFFQYNIAIIVVFLLNLPFWLLWLQKKAGGKQLSLDSRFSPDFPWRSKDN